MGPRDKWKPTTPSGRVFDIKRYSIHDGPGIRTTVFLKGCSLGCLWCHNPESVDPRPELMHWPGRCARCYACVAACPTGAIAKDAEGAVVVDRSKCDLCGKCAEACLYDAMQIVGREMSVDDVMAEVEKDRIFYEQSGGGVTLSGGDPAVQPAFAEAILDGCRARGLRTAVDTAGFSSNGALERLASKTDLVLFDLKVMDEARHRETTGVPNGPILENLGKLAAGRTEVWVRIPLVAGVNDGDENIRRVIAWLAPHEAIKRIDLLPYHSGGLEKARRIGKEGRFRRFEAPSEERIAAIEAAFREAGFEVRRGG
ncbi:MAG: glycyl-radical enzyme activating protein [Candidatus Aminicenantes bacterium]|nr:glycyl-radical enzyme activating protein [Candidatus Aminicenantes bacterium]